MACSGPESQKLSLLFFHFTLLTNPHILPFINPFLYVPLLLPTYPQIVLCTSVRNF